MNLCAEAASTSRGKDLIGMTEDAKADYVRSIWDKHTNVSEHFVKTVEFQEIPRFLTLLMAFQRDGFTMTERSQRYCEPEKVNEEYNRCVADGQKFQDARKCLPLSTPSNCVVTMNREAARNIARNVRKYEAIPFWEHDLKALEFPEVLANLFDFTLDNEKPKFVAKYFDLRESSREDEWSAMFQSWGGNLVGHLPLYSFHQMLRHRKVHFNNWQICTKANVIGCVRNDDAVHFVATSDHWSDFIKTRSGNDTQEPLRSFAKALGEHK
jgi:hypothetical protein